MKLTKTITKKDVVKALESEPLVSGDWFGDLGQKHCNVCAVGAVLRKVSFEKWLIKIDMGGYVWEIAKIFGWTLRDASTDATITAFALIKRKRYMEALSNKFERMTINPPDVINDTKRKKLISWVKKYFPTKFELTADTANV